MTEYVIDSTDDFHFEVYRLDDVGERVSHVDTLYEYRDAIALIKELDGKLREDLSD